MQEKPLNAALYTYSSAKRSGLGQIARIEYTYQLFFLIAILIAEEKWLHIRFGT